MTSYRLLQSSGEEASCQDSESCAKDNSHASALCLAAMLWVLGVLFKNGGKRL